MTMNSGHLVDPELRALLDVWPTIALSDESIDQLRDAARLPLGPIENPEQVEKSHRSIPGPDAAPDVSLTLYRPAGADGPLPCIYHIHGGGYVGGAAAPLEPIHRAIVHDLGCAIVTVDYRLAPETPYPGPLEDCYAGLVWAYRNADEIRIDPGRIGVMGESAGGGLAAALALLARDRSEVPLAFQHLIYPMLDDRTCVTAEPHPYAGEFIWTAHNNRFGWRAYLGMEPGTADVEAYAAPARAKTLAGLPPTYIATGALDLFVEEDIDYARRLMRAGVPVELHVYPGGFHGFNINPAASISAQASRDSQAALQKKLVPIE